MNSVVQGSRPARPKAFIGGELMSDDLWRLVTRCWTHAAATRPTSKEVIRGITDICDALTGAKEDSGISVTESEFCTNASTIGSSLMSRSFKDTIR